MNGKKVWVLIFLIFELAQAGQNCRNRIQNSPSSSARLLILSATDRPDSKSEIVAKQVKEIAKEQGFDVDFISLLEVDTRELTGDQYFNKSLQFRIENHHRFQQADAILIVYPEYDGNVAGVYYHYMNHMRAGLTGKAIGVIGISSGFVGGRQAADLMAGPLLHRKATLIGEARVFIPEIDKLISAERPAIQNKQIIDRIQNAIQSLMKNENERQMFFKLHIDLAIKTSASIEVFFNSGISVFGTIKNVEYDSLGRPLSIQWLGPTEIRENSKILKNFGKSRFKNGLTTPIGNILLDGKSIPLSAVKQSDFESLGLHLNSDKMSQLQYASGFIIKGRLISVRFSKDGNPQILTFEDSTGTSNILVSEKLESLQLQK